MAATSAGAVLDDASAVEHVDPIHGAQRPGAVGHEHRASLVPSLDEPLASSLSASIAEVGSSST
ncbi:MAG TPA: hypothetical protein DHV14_02010 [Micrococcales bacterium]|uniref:hypothetical protein n=1 Tax=Miniimonas arenae TaxID=676201 RepID=UPI000EE673FD|nr:hypothetical protein [Miniimonas arenae]HCX83914.1 hypothetical protein [Micrococcales bacterium]